MNFISTRRRSWAFSDETNYHLQQALGRKFFALGCGNERLVSSPRRRQKKKQADKKVHKKGDPSEESKCEKPKIHFDFYRDLKFDLLHRQARRTADIRYPRRCFICTAQSVPQAWSRCAARREGKRKQTGAKYATLGRRSMCGLTGNPKLVPSSLGTSNLRLTRSKQEFS